MRVAFLGLGIMGRSMAANLVKAGHEVAVWNRSSGKDVEGARSAASPNDAAKDVEVVWICVSDTKAVEQVLFGADGVESVLAADTPRDVRLCRRDCTYPPGASGAPSERHRRRGSDRRGRCHGCAILVRGAPAEVHYQRRWKNYPAFKTLAGYLKRVARVLPAP